MIEFCVASVYNTHESAWGSKTSSGKKLNDRGLSTAHKTYPLNSFVKVTNRRTGKAVVLQVIDRGPFKKGRCVDLSEGAAKHLRIYGLGPVIVEAYNVASR